MRTISAIRLVIKAAGVTNIVSIAVSPPKRRVCRPTIHTLATRLTIALMLAAWLLLLVLLLLLMMLVLLLLLLLDSRCHAPCNSCRSHCNISRIVCQNMMMISVMVVMMQLICCSQFGGSSNSRMLLLLLSN